MRLSSVASTPGRDPEVQRRRPGGYPSELFKPTARQERAPGAGLASRAFGLAGEQLLETTNVPRTRYQRPTHPHGA